jgi:hypothetical protein
VYSGYHKSRLDDLTDWQRVVPDAMAKMYVSGDWIYYIKIFDERTLYRVRTDGTGSQKLADDKWADSITVVDDWVYYHASGGLYRVRIDGTGRQTLDDGSIYDPRVVDGWIYYYNAGDWDNFQIDSVGLIKIRTDGTGKQKIAEGDFYGIAVAGDWIYYPNRDDNDKLYKIRTDGTGKQKFSDDSIAFFRISGEWIYFVGSYGAFEENPVAGTVWVYDRELYRIRTDGTGRQKLADHDVRSLDIIGDWIYHSQIPPSGSGGNFRMRHDGTGIQEINLP